MKIRTFAFVLAFFPAFATHAEKPVFTWPDEYQVSYVETSKTDTALHFVNISHIRGAYARNDNEKFGLSITRPDLGKEFTFKPDGSVVVRRKLPADYVKTITAQKDHDWKLISNDTVDGKPALKYQVTGKDFARTVWLSPDKQTMLRFQEGDTVVTHYDYVAGSQDAQLFEVPGYPSPKF